MTSAEEDDLSALCPYCNTTAPIYTCPRCFARSCSVACSKKHKLYRQCNGVRDPTAYVKRSRLMTESGVNRDYAFLMSLEKGISKPVQGVTDEEDGDGKEGAVDRSVMKERVRALLNRNNITLKWAPWNGFERAKENRTRAVTSKRKGAHVEWSVEWSLLDSDHRKILDHYTSENRTVMESFFDLRVSEEGRKTPKRVKVMTDFYLVLEAPANKKHCVKLDPNKHWTENLRERTVIEFPQVLVTAQGPPEGWDVMEDTRKIVELKSGDEGKTAPKRKGNNIDIIQSGDGDKKLPVINQQSSSTKSGIGQIPISNELTETSKRKLSTADNISNAQAAIKRARNAD